MLQQNTLSKTGSRRNFFRASAAGLGSIFLSSLPAEKAAAEKAGPVRRPKGSQRLGLKELRSWESMGYGMFIHFGMSTFAGKELPSGNDDPLLYAPDSLDVDQWISVAKEAGMKYAVLTTKHVAGHCLWPSRHSDYTVASSANKTDVVQEFVNACRKHGIRPGFYYCSWDNHHKFGSQTPSDVKWTKTMNSFPRDGEPPGPFTSSMYQTFQTAQITELLTQYGPIAEVWIDIPGVLGRGYRSYLYDHIARLQPEAVIMMNSGIGTGEEYNVAYAWPSDIIAIERNLPPDAGHKKWRTIEGKEYYMPGEVCDPIGKEWFYVEGDKPRPDKELVRQFLDTRARGANFLLDVGPDKHGVIPDMYVKALMNLKKGAGIR